MDCLILVMNTRKDKTIEFNKKIYFCILLLNQMVKLKMFED
jgi:hypothetical protein